MMIKNHPYRVYFPISGLSIPLKPSKRNRFNELMVLATSLLVVRIYSYTNAFLTLLRGYYGL